MSWLGRKIRLREVQQTVCEVHVTPNGTSTVRRVVRVVRVCFKGGPNSNLDCQSSNIPWERYEHGHRRAEGNLDREGGVDVPVTVGCDQVVIRVLGTRYRILLTELPRPDNSQEAVTARLVELGYYQRFHAPARVSIGATIGLTMQEHALLGFQEDTRLDATGELDQSTVQALVEAVPRTESESGSGSEPESEP